MKNKSVKTMVASVLAVGLMMGIPASAFAVSPGGMSVPSAQSVDSSENCAQILDWLGIQIPRHFDSQAPYKINTLSESDPNYWQAEWETQVYNYKMVRNYPTLYTQDAWDAAQSAGTVMMGLHPESLTDANKQQILEARDAIAALADHQLKPYSDGINGEVIYLWGDDMPVTTLAEDLQFPLVNYEGESVYDNADFQPFLIPYLLDDPSSAKGTIIVASGGGNTSRSNPVEAYAVCPEFNKLGYNCFLLQRRVAPYNNDDIVMDMQRAVRMVKYYSDQWGIDLEGSLLHTALGQDIYTQESRPNGHYHHIDVINAARAAGSIPAFIEQNGIRDGIMHACVAHGVPYVLAGSIRDDGPLPGVYGDVYAAQNAMRELVQQATTVICVATQLHTIATGNMTPSYCVRGGRVRPVYLYCVDVSEFVTNKLRDRGSLSSVPIVANAQDFLCRVAAGLGLPGAEKYDKINR